MRALLLLTFVFLARRCSAACNAPAFANLSVPSDFSVHRFLGIWYQIEWFSSEPDDELSRAYDVSQSFDLELNSSARLLVFGKARKYADEDRCVSFGPWLLITMNGAKMTLKKQELNSTANLNWPYYVLQTDYEHYALTYACIASEYVHTNACEEPVLRVFSRTTSLADDYLDALNDYIEENLCINATNLETTVHAGKSCYANGAPSERRMSSTERLFYSIVLIVDLLLIFK